MKLIYGYLTSMAVKFQAGVSIQGFAHPKPRTFFFFFFLVIESLCITGRWREIFKLWSNNVELALPGCGVFVCLENRQIHQIQHRTYYC